MRRWAVLLLVVFFAACSSVGTQKKASVRGTKPAKPLFRTTEFPSVVVPADMKKVEEKSWLMRTSEFVTGVLVLEGRVSQDSLALFFERQLEAKGWRMLGRARYGKRLILAFHKSSGSCFVYIGETGIGGTEVRIWVSEILKKGR